MSAEDETSLVMAGGAVTVGGLKALDDIYVSGPRREKKFNEQMKKEIEDHRKSLKEEEEKERLRKQRIRGNLN